MRVCVSNTLKEVENMDDEDIIRAALLFAVGAIVLGTSVIVYLIYTFGVC